MIFTIITVMIVSLFAVPAFATEVLLTNEELVPQPTQTMINPTGNSAHDGWYFQHLARLWDKLREQAGDVYIRCRFCKVFFGVIVIQKITLYDKYQSALDRVEPCRITVPLLASREVKQNAQIYLDKFRNTYGMVRNGLLIYINKSKHDTYYFEKLFLQGEKS